MNRNQKEPSISLTSKQIEYIRNACIEAARQGFMDASMSGLCTEGAMEAAISSMQLLDINQLQKKISPDSND